MLADLLYLAEIWLLLAALLAWMFCRVAIRLRAAAPTLGEFLLAVGDQEELAALPAGAIEDLWRAIRIYENA